MEYFDLSESRDTMIKITEEDLQESTRYVDALLQRQGISLSPGFIPHEVRRLAIAVAHRNRALLLSGRGNGMSETDAYMAKYKAYDAEAKSWEILITPDLIMGVPKKKTFSPNIALGRS